MKLNKVYVLGVGPGHRDYLLKKTEKIISKMDVLIAGARTLNNFSELDAEKIKITLPLTEIRDYIQKNYRSKKIAVLVSGDPGLYSLMNYLKRELKPAILEVIPGISSLQLAASRIKLDWHDLQITSLHGKDNQKELIQLLSQNKKVGFFTDKKFPPEKIAQYLIEKEVKAKKIFVFENLSYPDEKITVGRAEKIKTLSFSKLNLMIIVDPEKENDK